MKKLMIVLMAALVLMGTLLVSCNQNVAEDKLSFVTISEDLAKGLTTSLDPNVKPVGQLAWYYKATKDDNGFFVTGQKTEWTLLPTSAQGLVGQSLGQMSYGAWKFEFEGRDYDKPTATAAYTVEYYCDGLYETINKEETALTVPLKQGAAFDKAGIIFKNLIFTLNGVEVNDSVKIPSTETGSTIGQVQLVITETGTENSWAFTGTSYVPATTDPAKPAYIAFTPASSDYFSYDTYSSHTYGFVVKYNDVAIMTPFAYTVYIELGYDMTISGDINAYEQKSDVTIEKTSESWTVQTAYTENTAVNPMVATTDATPAKLADATSTGKTTVNASVAALAAANGEIASGSTVANSVKVTVSSIETASVTFTATADNNAFAGIDLKLIKKVTTGTESVTSEVENANFGTNNPVTVETYIAKGLTNVALTYPADTQAAQPTLVDYDPLTGRLVFTTTHFSEFAVFADQYIFDKTTNMAYKLDNAGLLDGGEFKDDHEYILLDPTKANLVSDDIDVFNASKSNWTVLHDSSDVENTTDFAGGYGTKIEPYLIKTLTNFKNISYTSNFVYYQMTDSNLQYDGSNWASLKMHGSIDGRGASITGLDNCLFDYAYGSENETCVIKNFDIECDIFSTSSIASLMYSVPFNLVVESVDVSGTICGYSVGGYLNFGAAQWTGDYSSTKMTVCFRNCKNTATLVSYGEGIGGFIQHPFCDFVSSGIGQSLITIEDSAYVGVMKSVSDNMDYFAYQGNHVLVRESYTPDFIESLKASGYITNSISGELHRECTPNAEGIIDCGNHSTQNDRYRPNDTQHTYTVKFPSSSGVLPEIGEPFVVSKATDAVVAKVSFMIAPNDAETESGSYLSTYMSEIIDVSSVSGTISTSSIKRWNVDINAPGVTRQGLDESTNTYHVYDNGRFYGHTHNGVYVYVIQYDAANSIVGVTEFSQSGNAVGMMYNGSSIKAAPAGGSYSYDTGLDLSGYDVTVVFIDRNADWYYDTASYAPFNGTNAKYPSIPEANYQTESSFTVDGSKVIVYNIEKKNDRYNYGSLRYEIRVTPKSN